MTKPTLKRMTALRCLEALQKLVDFRARQVEQRSSYHVDDVIIMLDEAVRAGLRRKRT